MDEHLPEHCAEKKKGLFYCTICDILCPGKQSLALHIDGKKHKYFSAKANPIESTYCSICDINFPHQNALAEHIGGKKHKKRSKMNIYAENKPEVTSESLPSCKSDDTANKSDEERMQNKSSIQLDEKRPPIKREANLEGEDPKNAKKKKGLTYCSICDITCTSRESLDDHFGGKKHKKMVNIHARLNPLTSKYKPTQGMSSESLPSCKSDDTANKSDEEKMHCAPANVTILGTQEQSSITLEEKRPPSKKEANLEGEDPKNDNSPPFESIQELQEFLTNYKIENEQDAAFAYQTIRSISNLLLSYTESFKIQAEKEQVKTPKVTPVPTFDNDNFLRRQEEEKQAETPKVTPVPTFDNDNFLRSQEEEKQAETPKVEPVPTFDNDNFYVAINNKSDEDIESTIRKLTEIVKRQLPSM